MFAATHRQPATLLEVVRPAMGAVAEVPSTPRLINTEAVRSEWDEDQRAVWMYMNHLQRPCFTPQLIGDMRRQQDAIAAKPEGVDYLVTASATPGTFNLGGDLDLFRRLVRAGDAKGLLDYATQCVEGVYRFQNGLDKGVVTIALVEGDALGGGLELALSCQIVVAERGVKMGFPEILFNLFPGMGAYSLVARKAGPRVADDLITTGKILSAEEMHALGLVDYLVEPGEGEATVRKLINQRKSSFHGFRAYLRAKQHAYRSVPYEELIEITREWVEAACGLNDRDLRMMERLVKAQDKRAAA